MTGEGEFEVLRLGEAGDGVIETPQGQRFVPGAVPGERVRLAADGSLTFAPVPGPLRRDPPLCPHAGRCGGCAVPHLAPELYRSWKAAIVPAALARAGIVCAVEPVVEVPPASRRRAVLSMRRMGREAEIGFHRARSHDIEPMQACAVLRPAIVGALPGLRALAADLLAPDAAGRMTVIDTPAGLDVAFEAIAAPRSAQARARLVELAGAAGLARLSLGGEVVLTRAVPALDVGGVTVVPPPGAFVQAVAEAEVAMARLVVAGIGKARRVADLFCGLGTLTFPMARKARVLAVDSDRALLAALSTAQRHAQGLKPIEARPRDLFQDPLSPRELDQFDAVVFDPPRAGARDQTRALARAKVARVVAVSCNPATLARDLAELIAGGYRLETVTPVDQFLFTAHIEAVAVLTGPR